MNAQYAAIPVRALNDPNLSAGHFRVLGLVAYYDRFNRNKRGCYLKQEKIAEQIGCSRQHTNQWLNELEARGYITAFKPGDDKRRRAYRVEYQPGETSPSGDIVSGDVSPKTSNHVTYPNPQVSESTQGKYP